MSGILGRWPTKPADIAAWQYDLDSEDVVVCDAVFQAVRPTGVVGEIPAN